MATAFRRKGRRFVARLDDGERAVVAGLLRQTCDFVAPPRREPTGDVFDDLVASIGIAPEDESSGQRHPDPALGRLLPPGHVGDEKVAGEFRRLTEHGLRERKAANLTTAAEALESASGDRVELDRRQAEALVTALTDVRLVLGERLGLRTDEDAERLAERLEAADVEDPQTVLAAYYDFLTWLQESLTVTLLP